MSIPQIEGCKAHADPCPCPHHCERERRRQRECTALCHLTKAFVDARLAGMRGPTHLVLSCETINEVRCALIATKEVVFSESAPNRLLEKTDEDDGYVGMWFGSRLYVDPEIPGWHVSIHPGTYRELAAS